MLLPFLRIVITHFELLMCVCERVDCAFMRESIHLVYRRITDVNLINIFSNLCCPYWRDWKIILAYVVFLLLTLVLLVLFLVLRLARVGN